MYIYLSYIYIKNDLRPKHKTWLLTCDQNPTNPWKSNLQSPQFKEVSFSINTKIKLALSLLN